MRIRTLIIFVFLIGFTLPLCAQRGKITKPTIGTAVLDPNQDGFVSKTTAGFSNDGYYVDEFETTMFGIPIFEDGETLNDIQAGAACGTTELTVDSRGFTAYGVLTTSGDLVFRFRVAKDRPSVEAYTILIDTDKKVGADDPNSNSINPGFEIDITLIKNKSKGVYVYDVDGIDNCPTEDLFYDYDSHFQIAIADIVSCGDPDYFYDYYVPFSDLVARYGLTDLTELRFVALTNVSATCALAGKISDIGGVNDADYADCNSCAFLELATNQCPTSLSNLCPTCEGFLTGVTPKPGLNDPLKGGEQEVSGTSVAGNVFVDVFNAAKVLVDQKTTTVNPDFTWEVTLDNVLQLGDSVTARAQGIGLCESGSLSSGASFTIVVQNIPPEVTGTTPTVLTYTENDPRLPIDNAFSVSDADDIELESAVASIIGNFTSGEDILSSAIPPVGLSTNYDAGSGVFTITGTATLATYQTLLRSIGYSNSSDNPSTLQRNIRIVVNDGLDNSNTYERAVNVLAVNDRPVITGTLVPLPFPGGTITIDNTIAVSDVDNVQLTGATISISGNYLSSEDALQFTNQNGITGLFDSGTGILTLSGTSSVANYTAAIASIEFVNNNATPSPLTRRISYVANDGTDNSATYNVFIDFPGVNGPPVIVDGGGNPIDDLFFIIDEDNVLDACINAIDPDGDPVAISTFSGSTGNGAYVKTEDLCFSFTPTLNFHGLETADVVVCDQSGLCDQVTVHITVNPVNDAPTVDVSTMDVNGNQTTEICISVSDVEGDPAVVSSGSASIGIIGDPIIGDLCLDYTPPNGFDGPDEISVTVCDVSDPTICSTAVIPINVIAPPNNPPETFINGVPGAVLHLSTLEDTPVLACFESVDPDGDDISLSSTTNLEGGGSLSLYNDIEFCFEFIPESNFNGKVTWEVVVCDDRTPSLCGTVTIEIDVLPVNDPPTAARDSLHVIRNVISGGNVLDNDFDIDGDPIHIEGNLVKGPDHGTALVNSDGSFSYQSDKTFRGIDSLVYQVCDTSNPPACDEGTLVIVVDDLPLRVYEGFTPNGDNSNEYWRIEGIDYYTGNEVKIFDRFNNLIFEMKGYDNETKVWKGDANRGIVVRGLPDGIYFYTIDLGEQGSKKLSGFVVLKRK
ncbi:MAG: Ig-like domain-containing protein [Cyclobacteriaceae bacterium]